jgi:diaminopimelate epimerase
MKFYKFDGAGNDFVIVDAREQVMDLSAETIARICHRRFGVGADGLMLLGSAPEGNDFAMHYYNSNGHPADMCGNGGRCISLFAHLLGMGHRVGEEVRLRFVADDGAHEAAILRWDEEQGQGLVRLGMRDVPTATLRQVLQGCCLNTGVPHYVQRVSDLEHYDVVGEGRRLRHHPDMGPEGANIDFVEPMADGSLLVRTYERGVEDETWACGTGVTACALVTGFHRLRTRGGDFEVTFTATPDSFTAIRLIGPVSYNFNGIVN